MGLHNLPASYDAWRTTPPDDAPRKRRLYCPDDVSAPLLIEGREVQIDATGTYDALTGALVSVQINGRHLPVHQVEAAMTILCPGDTGDWTADLSADRLNELCAEAARDVADDYGDWLRDQRGDH